MASLFSSLNSVDIPWHKLVPAGVRLWWSQQSSRDQLAVKVLALFLVLAGGFKLVWLPVHEQIAQQEAQRIADLAVAVGHAFHDLVADAHVAGKVGGNHPQA